MVRAPEIRSRESEALLLLAHVLSGTRTSRLDLALLETHKAGDVHAYYHPKEDPSAFTVTVEANAGVPLDEIEEIVWGELERLGGEELAPDALDRTLHQIEANHLFSNQGPSNRGFVLGWHEAHGDVGYADRIVENLRSLTASEIRETAERVFRRDRCGIARLEPMGGNGSARAGVETTTAAWSGPPGAGPSLHGVICPRRRFRSGLTTSAAVRRGELDNGMRVHLLPDRTDAGVAVSLLFEAGSRFDSPDRQGLATLTADTMERGTSALDFVKFTRRFENLGSSFHLTTGAELVHANAQFLARHLDTGLDLIADLLRDPGFRGKDLETARALALSDLHARRDDLDDVAEDLFFRGVARGHPYGHLPHGTEEGVAAVTDDEVRAFHARTYRPDRAQLAIVGDFDEDATRRRLQERFGTLPRPDGTGETTPEFPSARMERSLVDTRPEKGQVKILYGGPGFCATDPDRLAGIAMNQILGGSAIRSRLGTEIRDNRGLAYSVYSRNYERSGGGFFTVHVGTRPENAREAVEAIRAELARVAEGVADEELRDAQDYLTGSFPLRFTTYSRLARFWTLSAYYRWPEDYLDTYADRVRALTPVDLKRAAERLVSSTGVLAVAGPVDERLEPVAGTSPDG
jgi:zinc protease